MIDIIFTHADFLIINKPADTNFHSEEGQAGIIAQLKQQLDELQANLTLYPVHRLDKMTSGLLIVALHKKAANEFREMFAHRQVDKYYLAISNHKPKKKQGWVKGDMLAARNGSYRLAKSMENPAITQFKSVSIQANERLFLLKPLSGKTHQLRVMMKSLGAPICGDLRYAAKAEAQAEERGYLHAYGLYFDWHGELIALSLAPQEGRRFVSSPCQAVLANWPTPWDVL